MEEMAHSRSRRRMLFWLLQTAFWLLYWVIWVYFRPSAAQDYFFSSVYYLVGVTWSFLLRYFYKKRSVHHFAPVKLIPVVAFVSLLGAFVWQLALLSLLYFGYGTVPPWIHDTRKILAGIWDSFYPLVIWSTLYLGFKIYEEFVLQKQNAERARSLAQTAQLELLRYQINPHFLFNTLSSVRALTVTNPSKAHDAITKISEFLRYSLAEGNQSEVPLSREIQIVQHYLDIERLQYDENLISEFSIGPLAEDYPIPIFLIHPLVENAVKHGMQTSALPLRITIGAEVLDDELRISVVNTGRWIEASERIQSNSTQTGLDNVRKRLQHFYPMKHGLEISAEEGSVRITISLTKQRTTDHAKTL